MKRGAGKSKKVSKFFDNKEHFLIAVVTFSIFVIALILANIGRNNITGHITLLEGIQEVTKGIGNMLKPVFQALFGGGDTLYAVKGMLFTQILFFIIIFGIISISLKRIEFFSQNPVLLAIITLAVSLLAIRGISSTELLKTISLPYSVLGVALTAGIPFVVYFIVINVGFREQPSIVRRIAWIFFAVIFIGLWIAKRTDLGDFHYIYLATALASIIIAWFDGTIKGVFAKIEAGRIRNLRTSEIIADLRSKINNTQTLLNEGVIDEHTANTLLRNYKRKIRFFSK